jgi:hypothetical protein
MPPRPTQQLHTAIILLGDVVPRKIAAEFLALMLVVNEAIGLVSVCVEVRGTFTNNAGQYGEERLGVYFILIIMKDLHELTLPSVLCDPFSEATPSTLSVKVYLPSSRRWKSRLGPSSGNR